MEATWPDKVREGPTSKKAGQEGKGRSWVCRPCWVLKHIIRMGGTDGFKQSGDII